MLCPLEWEFVRETGNPSQMVGPLLEACNIRSSLASPMEEEEEKEDDEENEEEEE
jgi:hypothetical protein